MSRVFLLWVLQELSHYVQKSIPDNSVIYEECIKIIVFGVSFKSPFFDLVFGYKQRNQFPYKAILGYLAHWLVVMYHKKRKGCSIFIKPRQFDWRKTIALLQCLKTTMGLSPLVPFFHTTKIKFRLFLLCSFFATS